MTISSPALSTLKSDQLHIGICDSGLGGLSILAPLMRALPAAQVSYVADDLFAPYGPLDKEVLIERAVAITEILLARGCDLIVVACNTLTAQGIDEMRARFATIFVGVEPYVNALNKGLDERARPAILCTVSTAKSARFLKLVEKCDPNKRSVVWPCPTLAREIERALRLKLQDPTAKTWAQEGEAQVRASLTSDLEALKEQSITHVILGCTHYPLVRKEIESYLGVPALSPCEFVARRVVDLTQTVYVAQGPRQQSYDFYSTKEGQWVVRPLADAQQLG